MVNTVRWGVKLLRYEGMGDVGLWVTGQEGVLTFEDKNEAYQLRDEYHTRNPKGVYAVQEHEATT